MWVFSMVDPRVPASCAVTAYHHDQREALGAAYLIAEKFCSWVIAELNKPE